MCVCVCVWVWWTFGCGGCLGVVDVWVCVDVGICGCLLACACVCFGPVCVLVCWRLFVLARTLCVLCVCMCKCVCMCVCVCVCLLGCGAGVAARRSVVSVYLPLIYVRLYT